MAKLISIEDIKKSFSEILQSSHINFLLGSGASLPAIKTVGNIENEVTKLYEEDKDDEANKNIYQFISGIQEATNRILDIEYRDPLREEDDFDKNIDEALKVYQDFLGKLEDILIARETNIIPKQANIFTTNYDLFIEKASEIYHNTKLNDGFGRGCKLDCNFEFSTSNFFNSVRNNGNLYGYEVILPSVNLIKIHGSMSWKKSKDKINFNVKSKDLLSEEDAKNDDNIKKFIDEYALVLPRKRKLHETVMDIAYYDLLRIYSNELDRENAVLIVIGFSFSDEHIRDITKRALKNLTLKIIIFAFDADMASKFQDIFKENKNVTIVKPNDSETITFQSVVSDILCITNKRDSDEQK